MYLSSTVILFSVLLSYLIKLSTSRPTTTTGRTTITQMRSNFFCPKKHFSSNSSCFMYFLAAEKSFASAQMLCSNYSDRLVLLENRIIWLELVTQLNEFDLSNFKFRVDLKLDSYLPRCYSNLLLSNNSLKCFNLVFKNSAWCLEESVCEEKSSFICEWRPEKYRTYNESLGKILKSVLGIFCLFGLSSFLVLAYFLVYSYKNMQVYLKNYYDQMEEHLSSRNGSFYFKKFT